MTSYRQDTKQTKSSFTLFEATVRLRWKNRYVEDRFDSKHFKILQQLWVDRFSQAEEWRDVPTD